MNEPTSMVIESGQGAYAVEFRRDVGDVVDQIRQIDQALVVVDATVAARYAGEFALLGDVPRLELAATEELKTLAGVERVCAFLQRHHASKATTLVAVGGGIIQDIATFAAHIFYRGIPFVYVPTTLLSMSDSCIGAKCALNFGDAKNQIGFFQAPRRVLIATPFLQSLPDADLVSGYGEIVKLALIGSRADYDAVARSMDEDGLRDPHIADTIRRSLQIKQRVIEIDEYERDLRKTLNYGHTFGHALEAITAHAVPHGIAVAWGCDLANFIALSQGLLDESIFREIHALLARHFRFTLEAPYSAESLVEKIRRDKKAANGVVQLILLRSPGEIGIVRTPIDDVLLATVATYVNSHDIFAQSSIEFAAAAGPAR